MSLDKELQQRSGSKCELCSSEKDLHVFEVSHAPQGIADTKILICSTCNDQINDPDQMDSNHWRCLNDSMWSEVPAIQVMAWRMLTRLKNEGWPQDLLDMMYLDEENAKWAAASGEGVSEEDKVIHKDCNGNVLSGGDSVVLIKDLNVKGASFKAKQGTAVRGINLVHDNAEQIEGKVNGQQIVILTQYVKKS